MICIRDTKVITQKLSIVASKLSRLDRAIKYVPLLDWSIYLNRQIIDSIKTVLLSFQNGMSVKPEIGDE